jgi:hypothetical protein
MCNQLFISNRCGFADAERQKTHKPPAKPFQFLGNVVVFNSLKLAMAKVGEKCHAETKMSVIRGVRGSSQTAITCELTSSQFC